MHTNPDCDPQIQGLVGMLNDQSGPVVLVTPRYQAFDKWNAEELAEDHEQVGQSQDENIARYESAKFPREGRPVCLP